jgi:hypothetical protein
MTPDYYIGADGSQAWDAIENWGLNYNLGCAWKYIVRAGRKTPDPREDLRKAIRCIERQIQIYERTLAPTPEAGK